jgi:hemerythrin superfamily protein
MGTATAKEPTTSADICEKIKHDHDELETFYKNYKEFHKKGDDEEAHKWFNQFVWEVSRHAVSEELIFYPLIASKGEKGQKLADQSRADHQATKNILEELQNTSDPDEFDKKMDKMMSELREHIKMEESEDIPYLEQNSSPSDRETAGNAFALGKNLVPSRPHAGVPNKPVALEAALGLLITPIDQLRNVFTPFPDNPE